MEIDLHRNSEGASVFFEHCIDDLQKIYHDMLSEEMAGPPSKFVMKG
jgi:hypothetical protein